MPPPTSLPRWGMLSETAGTGWTVPSGRFFCCCRCQGWRGGRSRHSPPLRAACCCCYCNVLRSGRTRTTERARRRTAARAAAPEIPQLLHDLACNLLQRPSSDHCSRGLWAGPPLLFARTSLEGGGSCIAGCRGDLVFVRGAREHSTYPASPPCTMVGEDNDKCLVCKEGKIQHPCKLCQAYLYCSKGEVGSMISGAARRGTTADYVCLLEPWVTSRRLTITYSMWRGMTAYAAGSNHKD